MDARTVLRVFKKKIKRHTTLSHSTVYAYTIFLYRALDRDVLVFCCPNQQSQ